MAVVKHAAATVAVAEAGDSADVVQANSVTRVHLLNVIGIILAVDPKPAKFFAICIKASFIVTRNAENSAEALALLSATLPILPTTAWLFEEVKQVVNKLPELPSMSKQTLEMVKAKWSSRSLQFLTLAVLAHFCL